MRLPLYPSLKLPFDFAIGAGSVSLLLLLLGLLRLYQPFVFVCVGFFLMCCARFRRNHWRWKALLPATLSSSLLLPLALAEPFFYDALVYHLALPWQALLEGGWTPHPENVYATLPPMAQLCALPLLAAKVPRAYAVLHLLTFVFAGGALYAMARVWGGKSLAALASFCLPLIPLFVLVPALPAAEGWAVLNLALGACLSLHYRLLPPVGILAGLAVASRLQALPVAAALIAGAILRCHAWQHRALALSGFLLGSSLWWGKNWFLLGEPFLPFGASAADALSKDAARPSLMAVGVAGALRSALATLFPHASYLLPLALAAFGATCLGWSRRTRLVAVLAGVGLLSWPFIGLIPRFLSGTSVFWLALPTAARSGLSRVASWLALSVVALLGLVVSVQQLFRWGGLALVSRAQIAHARFVINNPFPAFAKAQKLPPHAKVLFVGEPRGFGFPRRFVAPSHLDVHPLADLVESAQDWEGIFQQLKRQGFTHLLVNWAELQRLVLGYPCAPWRSPRGQTRFMQLIQALEPPVVAAPPVAIYSLPAR